MTDESFLRWMAALEARHLSELTFAEVSRALRALSSSYVERRARLTQGAALAGTGKRAAFALFYGPLHYLLVRHIVSSLGSASGRPPTVIDLGCGTGAASVAWASSCSSLPQLIAVDRHPWAVQEAQWTYRLFGLRSRTRVQDVSRAELPPRSTVLLAFTVNELPEATREALLTRLLAHAESGGAVLIVEPLARSVTPWWPAWERQFEHRGGRSDEWRTRAELPALIQKLDRAAGLDHREITGRSLWIPPR